MNRYKNLHSHFSSHTNAEKVNHHHTKLPTHFTSYRSLCKIQCDSDSINCSGTRRPSGRNTLFTRRRYNVNLPLSPTIKMPLFLHTAPQSPPPHVTSTRSSPTTASVEWDEIVLEDLRGWLESYEVEYENVTSRDQCSTNISSNTETVSVDQKMYEMTGLDPGLQYCVRVAGRTSAGVGPFSHTVIACKFL